MSFLVFLFQAFTGFGLYAAMSKVVAPELFKWIVPMMGGDFVVRQWHHMSMWFFIIFSMIHVYLVFYHDSSKGAARPRRWRAGGSWSSARPSRQGRAR